jgi:hypothetical protein
MYLQPGSYTPGTLSSNYVSNTVKSSLKIEDFKNRP